MNTARRLFLAAAPLAIIGALSACKSDHKPSNTTNTSAKYAPDSCCAKAAADGKVCTKPCCVDAAKGGNVCKTCNKI